MRGKGSRVRGAGACGTSRLTARGRPKRSARFFLRSSSSGSVGSSGAPRFLTGCFLLSADASIPKRSALAFSFPSFYSDMSELARVGLNGWIPLEAAGAS